MAVTRILSATILLLAFTLGLTGSDGFYGIAIAGDYYSGSRVVDNPGGGKRTEYDNKVYVPSARDISGGVHGGPYTHGQAVWFPQGTGSQPVTPPPPPPESVSVQRGIYDDRGKPGDAGVGRNFSNGFADTRAQDRDNRQEVSDTRLQYRKTSPPVGMSAEEQELWRRGILHRTKYGR